jgi:hypothetical protein
MRFEKIWIEQCRARRSVKRRFGVKAALDYLVGEKLRTFCGRRPARRRVPARAAAIPCGGLASVQRVRARWLCRHAEADRAHAVRSTFVLSVGVAFVRGV